MFNTFFYNPLYNSLVVFLHATPHGDIGVSIILLTLLVKIILYPLNKRSALSQHKMKKVDKELKALKQKIKDQAQLARETMDVYKRENIKPFSSIFALLIQIPIFFALYIIFSKGMGNHPEHLYSFLSYPAQVNTLAFGVLDVSKKYIAMGILTGFSYFVLAKVQIKTMNTAHDDKESFAYQFNDMLKKQMLYVFPLITGLTASALPSAIALYWITSNLLTIVQTKLIQKHLI